MSTTLPVLFTTTVAPKGFEITHLYPLIQCTRTFETFGPGGLASATVQACLDQFAAAAPDGANAIIGVCVTSCISPTADGALLYLTYLGTPACIVKSGTT